MKRKSLNSGKQIGIITLLAKLPWLVMTQLSIHVLITISHLFDASYNDTRVRLCSCTFVLTASYFYFEGTQKKRQRYTLIDFLRIQLECGPSERLLIRRPIDGACRNNRTTFCKIDNTDRSIKRWTNLSACILNYIMANSGTNLWCKVPGLKLPLLFSLVKSCQRILLRLPQYQVS